jgi:hypothetical protein
MPAAAADPLARRGFFSFGLLDGPQVRLRRPRCEKPRLAILTPCGIEICLLRLYTDL